MLDSLDAVLGLQIIQQTKSRILQRNNMSDDDVVKGRQQRCKETSGTRRLA